MVSEYIKSKIRVERSKNVSFRKIGKTFNLSKSAVEYICKKVNIPSKKRGRKEKISKSDKRRIIGMLNDKMKSGSTCSSVMINKELDLKVSKNTICRFLKGKQFSYRNIPSKFRLTHKMKIKRVEAAKRFIIEGCNWNKVIFQMKNYLH